MDGFEDITTSSIPSGEVIITDPTDEPTTDPIEDPVDDPTDEPIIDPEPGNEDPEEKPDVINGVLYSIKQQLGYPPELTSFDPNLVMYINAGLARLRQLGLECKFITGPDEKYTDIFGDEFDESLDKLVRMYLRAKTKIMFDPASSSSVLDVERNICNEYEFAIQDEIIYLEAEKKRLEELGGEDDAVPIDESEQ